MDHTVKLTVNGETREFPMGITYKEVVKAYEKTSPAPVILVIAGGKICELHKKAERKNNHIYTAFFKGIEQQ